MKQFNLEKALAGEPVVTRNGKKVTQLTLFEVDDKYPLSGVVDRSVICFTIEGEIAIEENDFDLFMATEKKSRWINVYEYEDTLIIGDARSKSKEEAVINKYEGFKYIKTIEITNEP